METEAEGLSHKVPDGHKKETGGRSRVRSALGRVTAGSGAFGVNQGTGGLGAGQATPYSP